MIRTLKRPDILLACAGIVAIFATLMTRSQSADSAMPHSSAASVISQPGVAKERTYTITTVIKLLKPCDPVAMNDPYQDVKILSQTKDSYTLEVTLYPLNDAVRAAREDRYAQISAPEAMNYLKPTVTCNWDARMRADLLAELRASGIEPSLLNDTQLVQQVSRWAMHRSTYFSANSAMPPAWYVDFPHGNARILPPLRTEFDKGKESSSWSDKTLLNRVVFGKEMFYQRTHGACTSSSIYMATIFRALGIPTRILYFIPPCDGNDSRQVALLTSAIHHHAIRSAVETGMGSCHGFANHMYNEVFVGGRWVRLNYDTPGQNIVDSNYLGLLVHIDTCADISETKLAETWGIRSVQWPHVAEPLTSINPYMLLRASDHIGKFAHLDNPESPELTKVTINAIDFPGTPAFKVLVSDDFLRQIPADQAPHLMIEIAEFLPGTDYHQLRNYLGKASHSFVMHAAGHPDIHLTLDGLNCNNSVEGVNHQGFGAQIGDADRTKIVSGVAYTLEPINTSSKYQWTVGTGVVARKP